MRVSGKVGLVAAGYVSALLVASAIVAIYVASTSGPDRQTYGAMYAFGDTLLFLGVFAVAGVPSSCLALFFLRPYRPFWRALSITALTIAATSLATFIDYVAAQTADAGSVVHSWSALVSLRMFVAPPLALAFLLSSLFAPTRPFRIALFLATFIEAAVFAYVAFTLFHPFRPH